MFIRLTLLEPRHLPHLPDSPRKFSNQNYGMNNSLSGTRSLPGASSSSVHPTVAFQAAAETVADRWFASFCGKGGGGFFYVQNPPDAYYQCRIKWRRDPSGEVYLHLGGVIGFVLAHTEGPCASTTVSENIDKVMKDIPGLGVKKIQFYDEDSGKKNMEYLVLMEYLPSDFKGLVYNPDLLFLVEIFGFQCSYLRTWT